MTDLPPESAGWSRDERALASALRDGWTVVVNVRKSGPHKHLVPWLGEAGRLAEQPGLRMRIRDGELTGRALGCWCAPEPCHADVLADEVNRAQRRPR